MSYGQTGDRMVLKARLMNTFTSPLEPRFDQTLRWELLILLWQNGVICPQYGSDIILGHYSILESGSKVKFWTTKIMGRAGDEILYWEIRRS